MMRCEMPSHVSETPSASPETAREFYARRLSFETDCWDVHESLHTGTKDFVLLDVRNTQLYEKAHVPGAINFPRGQMTESKLVEWPADTLFVVYCAGPHCNGADKAALRLAQLGKRVKVMIGGMTGWADEGFSYVSGPEPGSASAE
jgi:rhodanese-related sulfurtransferase